MEPIIKKDKLSKRFFKLFGIFIIINIILVIFLTEGPVDFFKQVEYMSSDFLLLITTSVMFAILPSVLIYNDLDKSKRAKIKRVISVIFLYVIFIYLSSLAVVNLCCSPTRSNDAKRISDVKQIQTALELYYYEDISSKKYPESLDSVKKYLSNIPTNPRSSRNVCPKDFEYKYTQTENGESYTLEFCLEQEIDDLNAGINIATPAGIPIKNNI